MLGFLDRSGEAGRGSARGGGRTERRRRRCAGRGVRSGRVADSDVGGSLGVFRLGLLRRSPSSARCGVISSGSRSPWPPRSPSDRSAVRVVARPAERPAVLRRLIAVTTGVSARAARELIAIGIIAPLLDELAALPPSSARRRSARFRHTAGGRRGMIGVLDRVKGRVSAELALTWRGLVDRRGCTRRASTRSSLASAGAEPRRPRGRLRPRERAAQSAVGLRAPAGRRRDPVLVLRSRVGRVRDRRDHRATAPRRQVFDNDVAGSDPAVDDVRTSAQRCADAFVTIAKQAMTVAKASCPAPRRPRRDHDARSPRVEDRDRDPRGHPRTGHASAARRMGRAGT